MVAEHLGWLPVVDCVLKVSGGGLHRFRAEIPSYSFDRMSHSLGGCAVFIGQPFPYARRRIVFGRNELAEQFEIKSLVACYAE
jgi:hypothetical protein